MADTGKLIDADAFIEDIKPLLRPIVLTHVIARAEAFTDASEPLRAELAQAKARIAELKGLLTRISDVEPRLEIDSTNHEDRDVFYEAVQRFRTIKGAQDAWPVSPCTGGVRLWAVVGWRSWSLDCPSG